jgi:hypothetical protein
MSEDRMNETLLDQAPSTSTEAQETPKCARRIRSDQKWDSLKEEIYRIYITEDNTLQITISSIFGQYGFKAR